MKKRVMRRFAWTMAAMAVGLGTVIGGNVAYRTAYESSGTIVPGVSDKGNVPDSIANIIREMKNGDRSRVKSLAEAYRYGRGVEKSMLNAMICYQIAEVDFELEAKQTFQENPNDEFARLFILINMYDRHYLEEADELLSGVQAPAPAWVSMMRRIIEYKGEDINGYILSLISPDSTADEYFLAFGCYLSNNEESDDLSPLNDLLKTLSNKVPFFYNRIGDMKLEEYKENPDGKLLKEAVIDFKKANDAGFLTPQHANRIFEEDIRNNIELDSIFSPEELEQLRRLGASASSEFDHAKVVKMTPADEAVALIESMTPEEVFDMMATFDGFEEMNNVYDYFEFPKEIGKPTMIIHGNAKYRDTILRLLELLPEGSMVYDETDRQGRFDRLFLDADNSTLLYVHVGINGNDTVLILFRDGSRPDIDKFIDKFNAQHR